jgi:tRNA-splicing ligase RtcB
MSLFVIVKHAEQRRCAEADKLRRLLSANNLVVMVRYTDKIVLFLPPEEIETEALRQIQNTASLPIVFKHVAVMPDCHFGKGATVGTVLPTQRGVVPAAVGVDIGCGMIAVRTSLKRSRLKDLRAIREGVERRVPMSAGRFNEKLTATAKQRIAELRALPISRDPSSFHKSWEHSLGTLGGGNHFIELCFDESDTVWLTLHSGSRGIGNMIGNHYIRTAAKMMKQRGITVPDQDLSYLPEDSKEFHDYIKDLHWAQTFARLNRDEMMDRFLLEMSQQVFGSDVRQDEIEVERINCHHNFTQVEQHFGEPVWVTRKGAVEARQGMKAMIPGSMGTRSYIVTGLGHPMSFSSAPHGAGRRFSRGHARRQFTMKDFDMAMAGIEHRRSTVLLDELPAAYKDIDHVMANAKELVQIDYTLKQIVNMKGD